VQNIGNYSQVLSLINTFFFKNTLINSWNFKDLDPKTIWHGNEHAQNVTAEIAESDPEDDKV
jgi:hypothetical protein